MVPPGLPMTSTPESDRDLVARVLAGERAAVQGFVVRITPVLRRALTGYLLRQRGRSLGRDVRQEVDDLVQHTWLMLFDQRGKALQAWDPDKGRSLPVFLARFALFQAASRLRTDKQSPWTEAPMDDADLVGLPALCSLDPLAALADRQVVGRLTERLAQELSESDLRLFRALYLEEGDVVEVCATLGINEAALYQRKRRLRQRVLLILEELEDRGAAQSRVE